MHQLPLVVFRQANLELGLSGPELNTLPTWELRPQNFQKDKYTNMIATYSMNERWKSESNMSADVKE